MPRITQRHLDSFKKLQGWSIVHVDGDKTRTGAILEVSTSYNQAQNQDCMIHWKSYSCENTNVL